MSSNFPFSSNLFSSHVPFPHAVIDDLLPESQAEAISESFWSYEDERWEKFGLPFYNENGRKKQMYNLQEAPECIAKFFAHFMSPAFVAQLSNCVEFSVEKADVFGAGMNVYAPGAELKKHADFNFNNDIQMYRCLNFLYYVDEWVPGNGGCLQLYDPNGSGMIEIAPKKNRAVLFPTHQGTPHGVSKSSPGFFRKSLGIYYYSKVAPSNVSAEPHRTIWKEND